MVLTVRDANLDAGSDYDAKFKVVPGTATSGANLTNLTGAAAVPNNSLLLANVLIPATSTSITNANIDSTVRVRASVGGGDATGALPVGSVHDFAGSTAPTGYLLCDGSAVSRTTYSAL